MKEERRTQKKHETGKEIFVSTKGSVSHEFEVVDFVPQGYLVWPIGNNIEDGYLPLCKPAAIQPFPGGRSIDPTTLKVIRTAGAQKILRVAISGEAKNSVKAYEAYIQKHRNSPSEYKREICDRMEAALPYMRQIPGFEG